MDPLHGEPAFVRSPPRRFEVEEDEGYRGSSAFSRPLLTAVFASVLLGVAFAAVSTHDFISHLDRQVHSIHCSFLPGAGNELGESGCRAVMLSPYSSFFRTSLWGGIPVSLWAMAVFAFLAYRAGVLLWRGAASRDELRFLAVATLLPVVMSILYGFLSVVKVGATCKVCVGIYVSSVTACISSFLALRRQGAVRLRSQARPPWGLWFAEGAGFVAILTGIYLFATPSADAAAVTKGCGSLVRGDDPSGVMLELTGKGGVAAIEVLDPLCPACRAFDERLGASGLASRLALKGVLFPLDSKCNWMVTEELHPGACMVSEAILCAQGLGNERDSEAALRVLDWAFEHQEKLRMLAKSDDRALKQLVESTFPKVKGCLGGYAVKNKLTKSLRWAVANAVPVLTPQLFVGEKRMCDEDTDLGLEYTLTRMLAQDGRKGTSR